MDGERIACAKWFIAKIVKKKKKGLQTSLLSDLFLQSTLK